MNLLIPAYVMLNIVSFLAFGWDKHKAKAGKWRTRESTLLLLSLSGAFGGLCGMRLFRHKTRKPVFRLVYVFAAVHAVLIAAVILCW